ncbi:hypothetical protein SAMN05444279_13224 [Ruegeria intermedia]|uniref:Uncharacterized protein n=1 Tax=Ruegeria intermedia TaxID=996115 RepID=A0A1M5B4Y4_9RHOB|nr:hypothetical protein [Ruegeria intermedia]SHF37476.1 hypothetical protein SAMN05444279_13224 [Ruegeria intermedia]
MNAVMGWIVLGCLLAAGGLHAETVRIEGGFGHQGSGWLFGSRRDQSCWIALPWHLVEGASESGRRFRFTDQAGQIGEAGPAVHARTIPGFEDDRDLDDLALARVTVGRRDGACDSRLGLPTSLAYVEALRGSPSLEFVYVLQSRFFRLDVEMLSGKLDEARGGLLIMRPRNPADSERLQKGISGGIVLLRWNNRSLPAAMELALADGPDSSFKALRFDRIRAAFEALERAASSEEPVKDRGSLQARFVDVRATVLEPSSSLEQLLDEKPACWRAAVQPGQKAVELVILVDGRDGRIGSMTLDSQPDCGAATNAIVEGRKPGGEWALISTSCAVAPSPRGCRINRALPYELRLRMVPPGGHVGLSRVVLE